MAMLFIFGLLSSIGASCMWLAFGPFLTSQGLDLGSVGTIGMIRQLSFVIGAVLAGTWADEGRILIKCIFLEGAQAILGLMLFALLTLWQFHPPEIIFDLWSCLRFGLGGAGFVTGFKLFGQASKFLGQSAIVHLISTQGATLFGALISGALPRIFAEPFSGALLLDVLSSILLCVVLLSLLNSSYDTLSTSDGASIHERVRIAVMGMWKSGSMRWAVVQVSMLVSVAGFAVFGLYVSRLPHGISEQSVYSGFTFAYGLGLWFFGALVHKFPNSRTLAIGGAVLLFASGLLFAGSASFDDVTGVALGCTSALLYAFGFPLMLHLTNGLILSQVPPVRAAGTRSSMLLYLSIILGAGEQIGGMLLSDRSGALVLGSVRTLFAGAVLALFWRTPSLKPTVSPLKAVVQ